MQVPLSPQGREPKLVGGGLIRSLGGWTEVKRNRLNRGDRIKSDERILGDSDFVMQVLAEADEAFDRGYKLKSMGYNIDSVEQKVLELKNAYQVFWSAFLCSGS